LARFLIEIKHDDDYEGCLRGLEAIAKHGAHLITQAEFGCSDGVHVGWLIVDVDGREEAKQLVPPQYRADARVVELRQWSKKQIEDMINKLESRDEGTPPEKND